MSEVKAAVSLTFLEVVPTLLSATQQADFQKLAATAIQDVSATSSLAWLPIATHIQILQALQDIGTLVMVEAVSAHMMKMLSDKPLLRPIKEAAFRRTGASPSRLLHMAPSIWPLLVRRVGNVVYEPQTEFSGVYRLLDLPPAGLVPAWTHSIAGSLRGVIEVSLCQGSVDLLVDEKARTLNAKLKWKARA